MFYHFRCCPIRSNGLLRCTTDTRKAAANHVHTYGHTGIYAHPKEQRRSRWSSTNVVAGSSRIVVAVGFCGNDNRQTTRTKYDWAAASSTTAVATADTPRETLMAATTPEAPINGRRSANKHEPTKERTKNGITKKNDHDQPDAVILDTAATTASGRWYKVV